MSDLQLTLYKMNYLQLNLYKMNMIHTILVSNTCMHAYNMYVYVAIQLILAMQLHEPVLTTTCI